MFIPNKSAPCLALRAVGPQHSSYITLLTLLTTPHSLLLPCSSQWTFAAALLFATSLHLLPPALQSSHIEKKRKGAGEGWGGGRGERKRKGFSRVKAQPLGSGSAARFLVPLQLHGRVDESCAPAPGCREMAAAAPAAIGTGKPRGRGCAWRTRGNESSSFFP